MPMCQCVAENSVSTSCWANLRFNANGELAVFPGSIVHLECVFARRLGNPEWTWTSTFRQYLTGWAIAAEEREWKYRLSIYYAKPQDSGTFTCSSPRAVHCEPLEVDDPHVTAHVEGSRLGHTAIFQCPVGYRINGTANITCHASGQWSGPAPRCVPIQCNSIRDEVGADPRLQLLEYNTTYGGYAKFGCTWGYRLNGPATLLCERDSRWSGSVPSCIPVLCLPLQPPANGQILKTGSRLMSNGRYKVGSSVQFRCSESHELMGEPTIVCTETGFWSHPVPFCEYLFIQSFNKISQINSGET
ncbi:hypothetical protein B566_EDAN005913 [Ephemera danica]|nr:hypothetical protein B566_EDAN005913 [Ephemera danica]